ncbi:MAG: histidine--tRNA ligase [Veillonellaceae bacterium]|nr:histidine--tRNA ligase [Veillonellaceae bacterium]
MIKALRGTQDILPPQSAQWQYVEAKIRRICSRYGFAEIRTPMFEQTELFQRGIGETTDVVSKEMYTFTDRGDRSLTLRPENTASAVRAYLEHKIYANQGVERWYYIGSMFRYDRPQAGRYREFHQFGTEILGSASPQADAEIIALALQLFRELGLQELELLINSVGCPQCRPAYRQALVEYFTAQSDELCKDCRSRLDKNPLRLLDCKEEGCRRVAAGAPLLTDYLCEDCRTHFAAVQEYLTAAGIAFTLDPHLVRGLDYYTKTAFEIQYLPLGAQSAVCGGGRYDGLVEEIGGPATPGIGFAVGLERLLLALAMQNLLPETGEKPLAALVTHGEAADRAGFALAQELRAAGLAVDTDLAGRSMRSRFKQLAKAGIKYAIIMGEDELAQSRITLRNLQESTQESIAMEDLVARLQTEE